MFATLFHNFLSWFFLIMSDHHLAFMKHLYEHSLLIPCQSDSNIQQKRDYELSRGSMFGGIRTSHEAQVQSPAVLGLGQVEMTLQHSMLAMWSSFSTLRHAKPHQTIQRYIFHAQRVFLSYSWEFKRMRITLHSRLYKWIWRWVWWLDETQQQSIYHALWPASP